MSELQTEIQQMKERIFQANLQLPKWGLVQLTWGNVSEINRDLGIIVIKPSGVSYETMRAEQMVVTDLAGNQIEEGSLKPSSDLWTHLELYRGFKDIQSVVHTHSKHAVSWAQAGKSLSFYGTTHADAFYGEVPITRQLTQKEVEEAYEQNTGKVILETFQTQALDPVSIPGVLVNGHGPFTWGDSVQHAIENSLILDEICSMAFMTELIQTKENRLPQYVLDKHYLRKHGKNAYYGQ
ncbi:L-ribulose-5-phosphate 4-epimerase AraD [Enterococcus sp. LJL98]